MSAPPTLAPHILVVAIDGLRASALGAYGNTTYPTPALDKLATESLLVDFCLAPAAELAMIYQALWLSRHPLRPAAECASLARLLVDRGYATTLLTDDPALEQLAGAGDFEELVQLAADPAGERGRAADVAQTALGHLLAAASEIVENPAALEGQGVTPDHRGRPRLLWVHARGMYGPWDAPLALQHALLEEDDPPPVESAASPSLRLAPDDDPDTVFRYVTAYAAQTIALDACWAGLAQSLAASDDGRPWLVVLLGARGFPLGEHGQIGGVDGRLYGEQLHVPFLLRLPGGAAALARVGGLASPLDLLPTLLAWLDEGSAPSGAAADRDGLNLLELLAAPSQWRDALLAVHGDGGRALRTAEWSLRCGPAARADDSTRSADGDCELFVKPDDRWEANEIGERCRDEVVELTAAAERLARTIESGHPLPAAVLPEGFS